MFNDAESTCCSDKFLGSKGLSVPCWLETRGMQTDVNEHVTNEHRVQALQPESISWPTQIITHYDIHYKHFKAADWGQCSSLTLNIPFNCFSLTIMAPIQSDDGSRWWRGNSFPEPLERYSSHSIHFIKSQMQLSKSFWFPHNCWLITLNK